MSDIKRRVVDKSASYTIRADRGVDKSETEFTTRGATGAVTFTLPAPSAGFLGCRYVFRNLVDQDMTVAGAANGQLLTLHDAAANSIAASTSSQKRGAIIEAVCVRTGANTYAWMVAGLAVGHTYTVAT